MNQSNQESKKLREIIFSVEEDSEDGFVARAIGEAITKADNLPELRKFVKEAVECHYENVNERPKLIRLHIVYDKVIAS